MWFAVLCQLFVAFVFGGLAVRAGVVLIPDSLADMPDPPDPYWL